MGLPSKAFIALTHKHLSVEKVFNFFTSLYYEANAHEAFRLFSSSVLKYLSVHMKANNCKEAEAKEKLAQREDWGVVKASLLIVILLLNTFMAHPFQVQPKWYTKKTQEKYFRSLIPNVNFFPCKYFLPSEIYTLTIQIMKYLMSNSNRTLFI